MTAAADAQRLQAKKRDQYASTLKRAFALAYAKTTPSTAVEWAELYVNIEARVAKSLRDKTDAIGDGKIFTIDVSSALRIRTGETDDTAL